MGRGEGRQSEAAPDGGIQHGQHLVDASGGAGSRENSRERRRAAAGAVAPRHGIGWPVMVRAATMGRLSQRLPSAAA